MGSFGENLKKASLIRLLVLGESVQAAQVRQAHDVAGKCRLFKVDVLGDAQRRRRRRGVRWRRNFLLSAAKMSVEQFVAFGVEFRILVELVQGGQRFLGLRLTLTEP